MNSNVLITGVSSGFGTLIARSLLAAGHTVVGSLRDADGRNQSIAATLRSEGLHIVEIDVCSTESVEAGVAAAQKAVGHIDVLINNAGMGVMGWQDAFTDADFQRLFDVNVFGVQRMSRAVLPPMKARGSGTLIQISSLLGQIVSPFMGPYNAPKHAVEALSENYRVELSRFGVESLIVQPGAFGTAFHERTLQPADTERVARYGADAENPQRQMAGFEQRLSGEGAPDPQSVADAIVGLLAQNPGERPFRTIVDGLGMGPAVQQINETSESMLRTIYGNMGMDGLLKLKSPS